MKILFVGLPYFGKKLAYDLNKFAPEHHFSFYDTYTSKIEQLKFASFLPFADLVVTLNGVSDKSGSLDLTIKLRKKILMHWQGTDVLFAMERSQKKNLNRKYIDYSENYTDAIWIKNELNSIKINCEILEYKWIETHHVPIKFESISAYSYLAEGKEDFYGWNIVSRLANKNPKIDFYIVGTNGKNFEHRKNVHFMGWVSKDKMTELRTKIPIFLRFPKHDGYSLSVLEALSCGNEVIWSMPHQQCHYATNFLEAENAFNLSINNLKIRELKPNESNIAFVKDNLSKEKILGNFLSKLKKIAEK
jgi:glycosyltransferase involved in cell wall biosynthesis